MIGGSGTSLSDNSNSSECTRTIQLGLRWLILPSELALWRKFWRRRSNLKINKFIRTSNQDYSSNLKKKLQGH